VIRIITAVVVLVALATPSHAADIVFTLPTQSADSLHCGPKGSAPARVKYVQVQWREFGTWRMLQFWGIPVAGSRDGRPVRIRTARADTALIRARTGDSLALADARHWSCWVSARRPVPPAIRDLRVVDQ